AGRTMKELLSLTVLSQSGAQFVHEFPSDTELSVVADRAQAALAASRGVLLGQPIQLLHVRTGRRLAPCLSLTAAAVRPGDELLLLPPPPPPPSPPARTPSPEASFRSLLFGVGEGGAASAIEFARDASTSTDEPLLRQSPSASASPAAERRHGSHVNLEDIEAATRHLEPRSPPPPPPATPPATQSPSRNSQDSSGPQRITGQAFSRALAPTLVTLIDTCQRLLCTHPDAEKLMQLVRSGSSAPAAPRPAPDLQLVRQLAEMGFPEEQAKRALALAHNSLADATDCLLAGESALAAAEAPQPAAQAESESASQAADRGFVEPLSVPGMLELFRQYSRAQFRPSQATRLRLLDMGFDEPGVTDALRLHNNDEAQALETLLSGQASQHLQESAELRQQGDDALTGLDPESPLYKALMENPSVQLAMCQPVTLLAFLSILDNPLTLNSWQNQLPGFQSLIRTIASLYYEHSAGGEGPHLLIS
ncbi:hypothetical protein BOX15_Mlig016131g1, partial [Macrostomum lignano]